MGKSPFAGKIRIRVNAVVIRDDEILLVKLNSPTRPDPIWMPPGGGVNFGESLESALIRELKEETGLNIQPIRIIWVHEFIEEPFHAIEFYFECSIINGEIKHGTDPELDEDQQIIEEIRFIPINQAGEMKLYPDFLKHQSKSKMFLPEAITFIKNQS